MKKEILKLTGLTEDQFYRMYPTEEAFKKAYPNYKMGGTPEAFPQIATADNFFSYGVPVPPTYYAYGGPVYPQIQTEAQFFSPVYSNSNNAYAVGGSYMEAYPQAKVYPQGPVGGSAFYTMQDGGQGMPEPQKDQTFYTQKMNDFFDKLRQSSYKSMVAGMMNTEEDISSPIPQLSAGKEGGMFSYQPGGTTPNYQTVTTADGQTFLVGPNNQLYSPFKGNQTTTTTDQQQQRVNYYPYMNNGRYIGTGLDAVANYLIPNNQRERYRNIREQRGLGLGDLTPSQLESIKSGTANIADINLDYRRTLFPWSKNKLKSVNIKFKTPGQAAAAAPTTQTQAPLLMPNQKSFDPTVMAQQPSTSQQTTTTTPATSQTQQTATTATTSTAAPTKQTTADVNKAVAAMQEEARSRGIQSPFFYNPESDEDFMPADERMKAQEAKSAVDAEFKNYENYKKFRAIQERMGTTPEEYDYNKVYDYQTKEATRPGAKASTPAANLNSDYIKNSKYPGLDDQFTGTNMSQRERLLQQLNSNDPKEVEYAKYRIGAMQDWDAMQPSNTKKSQAPAKINSKDDAATKQKKAGYNDPNRYINQDYINSVRNQARGANGLPPSSIQVPADTMNSNSWPGNMMPPGTPKYDGPDLPFRMGGPYALPMYQGMTGPSQVPFQAPWQRTLDLIDQGNYKLNEKGESQYVGPDQFEVGYKVGRTKQNDVNPYGSGIMRMAAGVIDNVRDRNEAKNYMEQSLAADQVFGQFGQDRGDYEKNTGAFRLDQMVPVGQYGGMMMYDVADLFFLTPQMIKKTKGNK